MVINEKERKKEKFQLNKNKCEEMGVCFSKSSNKLDPIVINHKMGSISRLFHLVKSLDLTSRLI